MVWAADFWVASATVAPVLLLAQTVSATRYARWIPVMLRAIQVMKARKEAEGTARLAQYDKRLAELQSSGVIGSLPVAMVRGEIRVGVIRQYQGLRNRELLWRSGAWLLVGVNWVIVIATVTAFTVSATVECVSFFSLADSTDLVKRQNIAVLVVVVVSALILQVIAEAAARIQFDLRRPIDDMLAE